MAECALTHWYLRWTLLWAVLTVGCGVYRPVLCNRCHRESVCVAHLKNETPFGDILPNLELDLKTALRSRGFNLTSCGSASTALSVRVTRIDREAAAVTTQNGALWPTVEKWRLEAFVITGHQPPLLVSVHSAVDIPAQIVDEQAMTAHARRELVTSLADRVTEFMMTVEQAPADQSSSPGR